MTFFAVISFCFSVGGEVKCTARAWQHLEFPNEQLCAMQSLTFRDAAADVLLKRGAVILDWHYRCLQTPEPI
ncbi:MAG: hypothetical protein KAT58_02760 [candidate division Zixibacteria bacterium]|nr:hypothetical protein [candidate division Zixibacteria bacterium]